jgi:hypothetical protein
MIETDEKHFFNCSFVVVWSQGSLTEIGFPSIFFLEENAKPCRDRLRTTCLSLKNFLAALPSI